MNRAEAFKVLLPLVVVSFSYAPANRAGLQTDSTRHAPSSQTIASPVGQEDFDSKGDARYKMRVSVDEVRLTFHAVDKSGRPVNDLKPADIDVFDDGAGPGAILDLRMLKERPLRIGFLVDASGSVSANLNRSRAIAIAAARALMQNKDDQGLAVGFRKVREINQPWSPDLNSVADGIRRVGSRPDSSLDGTSLFDSLWSTCDRNSQRISALLSSAKLKTRRFFSRNRFNWPARSCHRWPIRILRTSQIDGRGHGGGSHPNALEAPSKSFSQLYWLTSCEVISKLSDLGEFSDS